MDLQNSFNKSVKEWAEHCEKLRHVSNPDKFIKCKAFEDLVSYGKDILPLIYDFLEELLPTKPETACFSIFGWPALVRKIVGKDFSIPDELLGKVVETTQFTKDWLGKNGFKTEKSS